MNTTFLDLRDELMVADNIDVILRNNKCPEIKIMLNGVPTNALVDTGSQVNAISERWFSNNKKDLGRIEILKLSNTVIKGATGNKSKRITQQVLLTFQIGELKFDSVFVVVPELIRECILGFELLAKNGCVIDLSNKQIRIQGDHTHEEETTAEILQVGLSALEEDIEESINKKVQDIEEITEGERSELRRILEDNKIVFRDTPGRITAYHHRFEVTDQTPYCQKGWPVPMKYQNVVRAEIKKMEAHGIIERAQSPYTVSYTHLDVYKRQLQYPPKSFLTISFLL